MSEIDPLAPFRQAAQVLDPVLLKVYDERPCFICGAFGVCGHREPEFDRALLSERLWRCAHCGRPRTRPGQGCWFDELGQSNEWLPNPQWVCSHSCYELVTQRLSGQP